MLAILDAAYGPSSASAACVMAATWESDAPVSEHSVRGAAPAAYEPGAFYKRELPLLLDVLSGAASAPQAIVIDGYVWLGAGRPGLGAHLHDALGGACAVVGIAKTAFAGASGAPVLRGQSQRPLFVTAAGLDPQDAAHAVARMHGVARLPTLVRRADALARQALSGAG